MAGTAKIDVESPRALFLKAARVFGWASDYAQRDSNPGAQESADNSEKALLEAAMAYAAHEIAGWFHERRTSTVLLKRLYTRIAREIIEKWGVK